MPSEVLPSTIGEMVHPVDRTVSDGTQQYIGISVPQFTYITKVTEQVPSDGSDILRREEWDDKYIVLDRLPNPPEDRRLTKFLRIETPEQALEKDKMIAATIVQDATEYLTDLKKSQTCPHCEVKYCYGWYYHTQPFGKVYQTLCKQRHCLPSDSHWTDPLVCCIVNRWTARMFKRYHGNSICAKDLQDLADLFLYDFLEHADGNPGRLLELLGLEKACQLVPTLSFILAKVERDFEWYGVEMAEQVSNTPARILGKKYRRTKSVNPQPVKKARAAPKPRTSPREPVPKEKKRTLEDEEEDEYQGSTKPFESGRRTSGRKTVPTAKKRTLDNAEDEGVQGPAAKAQKLNASRWPKPYSFPDALASKAKRLPKSPRGASKAEIDSDFEQIALARSASKETCTTTESDVSAQEKTAATAPEDVPTPPNSQEQGNPPAERSTAPKEAKATLPKSSPEGNSPAESSKAPNKAKANPELKLKKALPCLASQPTPNWAVVYEPGHLRDLGLEIGKYNNIYETPPVDEVVCPSTIILAQAILERLSGHCMTTAAIVGMIKEWSAGDQGNNPFTVKQTMSRGEAFVSRKIHPDDQKPMWQLRSKVPPEILIEIDEKKKKKKKKGE